MADNQVNLFVILARKIIPKTRKCVLKQQETTCQKDQLWCKILQKCRTWIQNS